MNQLQGEKREFPKPFLTEWEDDGSRTIDLGHRFEISVDGWGFHIYRISGPWSVNDLFDEMSYWPEKVVWTGSARTLVELLKSLVEPARVSYESLLALIIDELDECQELGIAAYLAEEERASGSEIELIALRKKWTDLQGSHRIPGLPSPYFSEKSFSFYREHGSPEEYRYNGLELDFDERGWTSRLCSPDDENLPDFFNPEYWHAKTLDGVLKEVERSYGDDPTLNRSELAKMLIEDDPRWRSFIETKEA